MRRIVVPGLMPGSSYNIQVRAKYGEEVSQWSNNVLGETLGEDSMTFVDSDGQAPSMSPTPDVTGVPRMLLINFESVQNRDPVSYEIHIKRGNALPTKIINPETGETVIDYALVATSSDYGPTPEAPVAGDENTLVTVTTSRYLSIRHFSTGELLDYNYYYWVAIVARDKDGSAPPSSWVPGYLDPTVQADLKAETIQGWHFAAEIVLASIFKTANSGQRVEFSAEGIRIYDDAGRILTNLEPGQSKFTGEVIADRLFSSRTDLAGRTELNRGGITVIEDTLGAAPKFAPSVTNVLPTPITIFEHPQWGRPISGVMADDNGNLFVLAMQSGVIAAFPFNPVDGTWGV